LMRLGLPRLQQRLDYVQHDLCDALQVDADMLETTAWHHVYRAQVMIKAQAEVTGIIQQATPHSQQMFDQSMQMRNYANHGMSLGWAEFLAKIPK